MSEAEDDSRGALLAEFANGIAHQIHDEVETHEEQLQILVALVYGGTYCLRDVDRIRNAVYKLYDFYHNDPPSDEESVH